MNICAEREFKLLKKIGFVRTSGSKEEKMAADILVEEVKSIGVEAKLEPFKVEYYNISKVKLEVLEPFYKEYTVTGYGMSGSTIEDGLECEFEYVEDASKVNLINAKDKIVLVNERVTVKAYENLVKAGVKGFISFSGSVFDDEDKTDLETRMLRAKHLKHGKIPGVTIRANDALDMLKQSPAKVKMTLIQEEGECDSHNVIASIEGSTYKDEEIHFVAHYDSVPFSRGVYDNGAGSVIIMELLRYFKENQPKRNLKFIWFGSEERGLLGSKYYTSIHEDELKNVVMTVNVDMAGPILGQNRAFVTADNSLCNMVEYLSKEIGFPMKVVQDVYSSDSTPYADKKVPAISFARFAAKGGAGLHNRNDVLNTLSMNNLKNLTDFIKVFSERTVNACLFPVPREIPTNMVKAVDKYLMKEPKKEK
ncbi:Zn-dependent exopeptidase M28 [Sedimentibacter sp. zth1]|uniref:M28 family metallopeptidase n=1 Tax=Sedimentibacter sp. zth1 TaxID=2816908 RepID=UPI001A925C68|nr:M28 family metallopeptidase [Sedimentibacter sp. zth1]QSX05577.1 Zn-dependent exopeptidase M28 [Sedimentibacter sp. zth1]